MVRMLAYFCTLYMQDQSCQQATLSCWHVAFHNYRYWHATLLKSQIGMVISHTDIITVHFMSTWLGCICWHNKLFMWVERSLLSWFCPLIVTKINIQLEIPCLSPWWCFQYTSHYLILIFASKNVLPV